VFPQTEIEGFRRYWRRRKPHSSTAIHYASDVTIFFDWVGEVAPLAITVHHIDQFIDWQRGLGRKPGTIRRRVIALRMFFDYLAYAMDRDLANPVQPRRHYVANGDSLPRDLADEVLQQLFAALGDHQRDRTIFTLMLHAGLRVGEVVNLEVVDVFLKADRPSQLRVHGKGQRERIVYLSATTTQITSQASWCAPPGSSFSSSRTSIAIKRCGALLWRDWLNSSLAEPSPWIQAVS
jgi:integrase/recombinase XerC